MNNIQISCFLVLLLISFGCKTSKTDLEASTDLSVVKSYLGDSFDTQMNESKSFALYTVSTDISTVHPRVKYVIFDMKGNKIVKQNVIKQGYIKWTSDTSVEIMDLPGLMQEGQKESDFIKTISVTTLQ